MIRTVVFDIGNVLAGFAWQEYFLGFGYPEETYRRLVKATVGSRTWQEHDRGALTDDEILNLFIENDPGIEKELRETLSSIHGMVVKYDYAIPWVQELKKKRISGACTFQFCSKSIYGLPGCVGFFGLW